MQRHWKILQWITSDWNCRGGFSVSLRRDEGCIYLCFLLRPVGFCFSKTLRLCHLGVTKSACPTDAEKCPPTAICPYSRWRSQPLSSVSRKQRYNTLDFASKIVCQQGCYAPLLETQRQRGFSPLNSPYFLRSEYPNCKKVGWNACSENAKGSPCHEERTSFFTDNLKLR